MTITCTDAGVAAVQVTSRRGDVVPAQTVLVVEDSDDIRELVVTVLRRAGLDVREATTGAECLAEVRREAPDVVVLDLGLPDTDGTEVCRQLRAETDSYVLMLTARAEEVDLLIGLAVGADGYMAKPFSPRELVARVQTMLRRPRTAAVPEPRAAVEDGVRRLAELEVDPDSREVRVDGAAVDLTRTEFDLLAALVSRPGRVLQRETLLREVWQTDWEGNLRLVEAHMSNLRRKLTAAGLHSPEIRTVRGVGYRLVAA
jgi:DNA-binding response OmpR family regulator